MGDRAHRFAPGILLRNPGTYPCSSSTNSRALDYQGVRQTPFPKLDLEASLKSYRAGNGETKFQASLPRAMQCKLALGESLSPLSGGVSGSFLGYGTQEQSASLISLQVHNDQESKNFGMSKKP